MLDTTAGCIGKYGELGIILMVGYEELLSVDRGFIGVIKGCSIKEFVV